MKNNMKLIMESWRNSYTLKEASVERSDEWLNEITVLEFLDSLQDKGKDLNIEAMQKAIAGAERKFSKEIAEIEQKDRSRWRKVWGALNSAKSLETVSGFLSDAVKATAGSAVAVGTGTAVVVGSSALAAPVFALGVVGYFVFTRASDLLSEKVVEMAVSAGTALEKLDIKDQDLAATPAYNIVDISDDTKKVVMGPDGELSNQETAALAVAYKKIEEAFQKIQEEQNQLLQLPGNTPEEIASRLEAWRQHHSKPMKQFLDHTADSYVKQAYAKMIKLNKDVTINKDGTP